MNPEKKNDYDNIVALRDSLPPLLVGQPEPAEAKPLSQPQLSNTPPISKAMAFLIAVIFFIVVSVAVTGYYQFLVLNNNAQKDHSNPVSVIEPPALIDPINPPSTPARDAIYTINAPSMTEVDDARITPVETAVTTDPASLSESTQSATQQLPLEQPQTITQPSAINARSESDDNISLHNKARIDAIEGYIIEMLTVMEVHKKELQAIKELLAKNSADINTNARRVAELVKQRQPAQASTKSNTPTTAITTSLPFRATSLRQIGEAVTVRVEGVAGKALLVIGQRYVGWQLTSINTDTREAEFLHLATQSRIKVSL